MMKVKIKKFKVRPSHWNDEGAMDKWMGKEMTVLRYESDQHIEMEEDQGEPSIVFNNPGYENRGWIWRESDFELYYPKILEDGDFEL